MKSFGFYRIYNRDDYRQLLREESESLQMLEVESRKRVPADKTSRFTVGGYSYTADQEVKFIVDFQHALGVGLVNWRERVCCPITGFNNRMRACIHIFDFELAAFPSCSMYITEQLTPMYTYFKGRFPNAIGSEYLGEAVKLGCTDSRGLLNQDLTSLTFEDNSFSRLISFDVLEHIPDYKKALSECARVLAPKGRMLLSAPFVTEYDQTLIRARVVDGKVQHLCEPEFHGDPLNPDGVLCFQHFGWDLLEDMRGAGFDDAYAVVIYGVKFGYYGPPQIYFVGLKS